MKSKLVIGIIVLFFVLILGWLYVESTKPLPGEKTPQEGREHLPEGSELSFDYNPPTGGNHYASWITKGFYDEPRWDGNLVHSLEHGYIIFWYNCDQKLKAELPKQLIGKLVKPVLAHFEGEEATVSSSENTPSEEKDSLGRTVMTGGSEGSPSAHFNDMPMSFSDGSCDDFKLQLKALYDEFGPQKLVFVPRVGLEYPLVLTAWGNTLKLNSIEKDQIRDFINAFRNNGPEHTNEP